MSRSKTDNDLYGSGLLGETLAPQKGGELANKFMIPPFTILNAREGWWQDRKRAWLSLGIQSEVGRGEDVTWGSSPEITETGLNFYRNKEKASTASSSSTSPREPWPESTVSIPRPAASVPALTPKPEKPKPPAIIHEPPALTEAITQDFSSSLVVAASYDQIGSKWTAPAELPVLPRRGRLCVDVETKDPELAMLGPGVRRPGNYVVGIAIGAEDGRRWYFPMRHEGGGNLDERIVWAWAREELNAFEGTIVGAKLAYDLDWLAENGVTFPLVECFDDVQIAEVLIDEWRYEFNLDALSKDYLGEGKDETLLRQAAAANGWKTEREIKSNLWRLPAGLVGPYAEADVDRPLRILPKQLATIEKEECGDVWNIERRLVRPLVDMTRRGVRVDVPGAERVTRDMKRLRDRFAAEVKRLAGSNAELSIADSLAPALRANGHDVPKTRKAEKDSIRKEWLQARLNDPLCVAIYNGRKVSTIISTFLEGNILGHNINGRIHCEWKQLKDEGGGTIARTASANPNLANIIGRDDDRADEDLREVAPLIRGLFLPDDGEEIGDADYSQIEYRLLAHFAIGPGAEEVRRTYRDDPNTDYHKLCAEMAGIPPEDKKRRKGVKGLNFSKTYGARKKKIASQMGCSEEEAQAFIDLYEERLPFTKTTFDACQKYAEKYGFVRSILKRRQHFNLWEPKKKNWDNPETPLRYEEAVAKWGPAAIMRYQSYAALNRKMQSSNADILKKGMVDAVKRGITATDALGAFLLTVYDSLTCSIPRSPRGQEAWRDLIEDVMPNAVKLSVPVLVTSKVGKNWGECI